MKHFKKYPVFAFALFFGLAQAQTIDPDMLPPIDYSKIVNAPTPITNNNQLINGSGYLTSEIDGSISNEIQSIGLVGNILSLSGDDSIVDLSPYLDNTDTNTNAATICQSGEFLGGGLDGCLIPAAGVDWGQTQISGVVDGASNKAFDFQSSNDFSLGKLFRVGDSVNDELFTIDGLGDIETSYLDTNAVGWFQINRPIRMLSTLSLTGTANVANGFMSIAHDGGNSRVNVTTVQNRDIRFAPNGTGAISLDGLVSSPKQDGASVSAFDFDTKENYSTGKLFSMKNNGSEKVFFDSNGYGNFGGRVYPSSGANSAFSAYMFSGSGGYMAIQSAGGVSFSVGNDASFSAGLGLNGFKFSRNYGSALREAGISMQPQTFNSTSKPIDAILRGQSVWTGATTFPNGGDVLLSGGDGSSTGSRGNVKIKSSETIVSDSSLNASQLTFFLDEANNKLIVKAKYSDGSTIKTFEVNANP